MQVTTASAGMLYLAPEQGIPHATIEFDPELLSPAVDTIHLSDERLVSAWGHTVYRIRLQRRTGAMSGDLRLVVLSS